MKISFITVNYKSEKYLEACIASIFKNVIGIEFEIIIVNNDEKKIRNSYGDRGTIKILEINKNIGFAKANNIGAKMSKGKYLCFINPDANIISSNIQDIIGEFERDLTIGIIGPKILKKNEVQKWSVGKDLNIFEIFRSKLGFAKSREVWNSSKKIKVDWVSGVNMFVMRDDFFKVDGFDENFFLYYEDMDLCKRVRFLDKKIMYFPFFKVDHQEGSSSDKKYDQKLQYFKSQDYYYKKWFSSRDYYLLKFLRFFYLNKYKINRD